MGNQTIEAVTRVSRNPAKVLKLSEILYVKLKPKNEYSQMFSLSLHSKL